MIEINESAANITVQNGSQMGESSQWNFTKTHLEDLAFDANFAWLIFSLLVAIMWFTYVTYYSSRVFGQILTRILNRLIKNGYIKIGSLSWDALAGKIMFRDIVFITEDFSMRVQDGWLVFRWWRPYVPKDISEDMSHSDTRLSLLLNGYELHVYNRSHLYNELERLFGLEPLIIPSSNEVDVKAEEVVIEKLEEPNNLGSGILGRAWRDLIPVIKIDICCGRAVFGNRLIPTTLCLSVEEAHLVYSTKPALSKLDHFMHVVKCRAENFKVTFAPSPKYTGLNDEPPRLMGEGFDILSSNKIDFYYYMDEPGVIPAVPEMMELPNGDIVESHAPMWGLDIRCGKGTDFSYGPWADRKRDQLFKFFFPQSYQPMKATSAPRPGEKRSVQSFDIRLSTIAEATVDILFSKCKETNAIHMTIEAGSYLEITIPWTVKQDGYTTKVSGQLLYIDASTSLAYRSLLEAETLEFTVNCHYPLVWNTHQTWNVSLTATKVTLHLIYEHRYFFQDLINDWSSKSSSDLLHFVPYTWALSFHLKQFELVTVANQFNWIDCSSQHQENAYAAFCGEYLELGFSLPFTDFLPTTICLNFSIKGNGLNMYIMLPEVCTSRPVILALSSHTKTTPGFNLEHSGGKEKNTSVDKLWRNFVKSDEGWILCWTVPMLSTKIQYTYHPISPPGPAPQAGVPTPEREELLLTPVRFPANKSLQMQRLVKSAPHDFDPTSLSPDVVNVELELGPSEIFLYGTLLRVFLHLKENIFGEDQRLVDMDPSTVLLDVSGTKNESVNKNNELVPDPNISIDSLFDARNCRPLHVDVSVTLQNIRAHLMKHCSESDPPCPTISLEKLSFEMHKTFLETRLQLVLSPVLLHSTDFLLRSLGSTHLQEGFVVLSALQVRGHALFSLAGRKPEEETLEYAWMIEAILGQLTGRLTLPQLQHVLTAFEAFVHLAIDEENRPSRPQSQEFCHHGAPQLQCSMGFQCAASSHNLGPLCPTSEELKYRMTRISFDLIDISLVESGTALAVQIYPLRIATCNLHSQQIHSGLSILIPNIIIKQYLATSYSTITDNSYSALNNSTRSKSEQGAKDNGSNGTWNRTKTTAQTPSVEELYIEDQLHQSSASNNLDLETSFIAREWLEVGILKFGPLFIDIGSSSDHNVFDVVCLQNSFLKFHDNRTRRLWFLWAGSDTEDDAVEEPRHHFTRPTCGCSGGCTFFGQNENGSDFFEKDESGKYTCLANPLRRGLDPAFGQSILRENVFLVEIPFLDQKLDLERTISEASNTSTIKHIQDEFKESSYSESNEDSYEENTPLIPQNIKNSNYSMKLIQGSSVETCLRPGRITALSSPTLLFSPKLQENRLRGQLSLPVLQDFDRISEQIPLSQALVGESQSELYYSAEDTNSSSEELVSLPVAVDDKSKNEEIPEQIISSKLSNSSVTSSSSEGRTSNVSFSSAISTPEDFSLVDLHVQTTRPITESPILLASYITHLGEAECPNWTDFAPKLPSDLKSITGPKFILTKKGFTSLKLVDSTSSTAAPDAKVPGTSPQRGDEKCGSNLDKGEMYRTGSRCDVITAIAKIDGCVNAMFCPLTLESAQRFAEALIPTLENLHPLSVITRIYNRCISSVISNNPLKNEKTLVLECKDSKEAAFQDSVCWSIRGSLQLPRINVCFLQAGIIEQIISLSALDNPRDLVCVSVAALCIEGLSLHFSRSLQERRTVQTVTKPPTETRLSKKTKSKARQGNDVGIEVVYIESSHIDSEQSMVNGILAKIHLQLRRLNNDVLPYPPENVTATAVPFNCSQVLFNFSSDKSSTSKTSIGDLITGDGYGIIMFECGLQGLNLRVVKRTCNGIGEKAKIIVENETTSGQNDSNITDTEQQTTGSVPSQSSHLSSKHKTDKDTTTPEQDKIEHCTRSDGDLSSCSLQIRGVWFTFAAPPRTTTTKKSDLAIFDWNLLNTASPSINAWMNSGDRLTVTILQLCRASETRIMAVLAGLMAEALDVQQIHLPVKSRYNCISLLSQTLQEDPSCQLCLVLHRYALMKTLEWSELERRLSPSVVPVLPTLKQGIVVLSRQWKNALFTPFILTYTLRQSKKQKPFNTSLHSTWKAKENTQPSPIKEANEAGDEEERTLLLVNNETESPWLSSNESSLVLSPADLNASLPLLGSSQLSSPPTLSALKRRMYNVSGLSGGSYELKTISSSPDEGNDIEETEESLSRNCGKHVKEEDLYSWMARQQKENLLAESLRNKAQDRMMDTGDWEYQQPSLLVDTHAIFSPLFSSLGLDDKGILSNFFSFGGSISILGGIEDLRVEIFESEWNRGQRKKSKGTYRPKNSGKFSLYIPPEIPAFLCEKVAVEVEVKEISEERLVCPKGAGFLGQMFWKPQRTTTLNFSLSVGYIAQQVNMPLLRLLHQLNCVYVNAKATQLQLKEQRPINRGTDPLRALAVVFDSMESTPSPQIRLDPSPSIISDPSHLLRRPFRPPSLVERIRSSARLTKGYTSMEEPLLTLTPDENGINTTGEADTNTNIMPACWRTVYYLLELYSSMAAASTSVNKNYKQSASGSASFKNKDVELGFSSTGEKHRISSIRNRNADRVRLIVFGVMKISRVRLLAMLSGLRLESEIVSLHSSVTYKEKLRGLMTNAASNQMVSTLIPLIECSLTGHLGKAMIVLLEGVPPSQQTVVKVTVGKSQALYSSLSQHNKDKNSGLLSVGTVHVDIPQHPGVLHGMMTRGSKQLSSTLQEFRAPKLSSRTGRNTSTVPDEVDNATLTNSHPLQSPLKESPPFLEVVPESSLLQPLVMQFSIMLQSLCVTAALLPSLQAQYQMDHVVSAGVTGSKAKFTVDLPRHSLSFTTKLQITENLPPSASIELPQVHVSAEYLQDNPATEEFVDGVVLCRGNYLSAVAEIGTFEHCLTTDLLNHLVFVQKVFMTEVNDVLVKVSGGDKPVPLWEGFDEGCSSMHRLLYNLIVRLKGIQITATTPTNTALRLETGLVELQLSNRVQNVSGSGSMARGRVAPTVVNSSHRTRKLFGRAKVDLNLSLGQLIRNPLFEEAEPEFQQVAFFRTRISLRNAFQDELTPTEGNGEVADKEVILITLTRPLIYLQPVAVDKAILVWLNYKNAYDYWTEQRGGWLKDKNVSEKLPLGHITSQLGAQHLGTLFLQLTVDDMGICMPLNTAPAPCTGGGRHLSEPDACSAVVVTLENSSISACNSGSLVSKGRFTGLCLRFVDDFETGLDDWKPDMDDPAIMNLCVVSEGTYEVCSRTVTPPQNSMENAKWILHVGWQMEGVDTHFDTAIGKQFSALGHTLTRLTGGEEEENATGTVEMENFTGASTEDEDDDTSSGDPLEGIERIELRRCRTRSERSTTINSMQPPTKRRRCRSRLIEKEMSEQARFIQDLRSLGASSATVEEEMRRLQELEAQASKDFRRVMLQRLRRQSIKASSIKDKLGLGTSEKPNQPNQGSYRSLHHTQSQRLASQSHTYHQRSKSVVVPPFQNLKVTSCDVEMNGGSSHDVCIPHTSNCYLPPIQGSPPLSCLATPTTENTRFRRQSGHSRTPSGPSTSEQDRGGMLLLENQSNQSSKNPGEPSVDLELDVKVFINSGKCVLHTRDSRSDDTQKRIKKERSFSSTVLDASGHQASPGSGRKRNELRQIASSSRLRFMAANTAQMAVDLTIFHIPGLDIKVYYESKTVHEESAAASNGSSPASVANRGKISTKKASLFTWMTLHSIPEETIISPHILEFLEQALEPIPITLPEPKTSSSTDNGITGVFNFDAPPPAPVSGNQSSAVPSGSFPVDVVVYCHVQPSTFRFSCLPVSRVECLLQLPSLHLVFSSKRSDDRMKDELDSKSSPSFTAGGLSVTGCLADFSLYIFHPYGGGKKATSSSARRDGSLSADRTMDQENDRKDSLSVNVEFVKFHLSRSRKLIFGYRTDTSGGLKNNRETSVDLAKAVVRFSTIIDIGSASFKYDMRRLPEILAFPKAWYRRTIVRRLFLGDLSKNDPSDLLPPSGRELAPGLARWAELHPDHSSLSRTSSWETLVVFAVNFTRLNVHMNMGNVMGNVLWLTKDFKAEGRLSIGSTGHKDMYIGIGLEGSSLDAKGGIVGGTIELSGIHTSLRVHEDPGTEPDHKVAINLRALECRLDYMGTSVLMGRVSDLAIDLHDEWRIGNLGGGKIRTRRTSLVSSPTKGPAMTFIHGNLGWDQLQLMISKSTTADLIKMYLKLDEFFQQQFRSSRRIFSTLSATSLRRKSQAKNTKASVEPNIEPQHHRHWQEALRKVAGLHVATLPVPLPATGTILGGTMELHGTHISLACFHGVNFKSKSWALFSLKDPCISFGTEAQEIPGEDPKDIHIFQSLSFSLGLNSPPSRTPGGMRISDQQQQQQSPASMATVCRISRTQLFPPQFRTLQDWFLYAFSISRLDAVDRFPSLERERERANSGANAQVHSMRNPEYCHTLEIIFAFPSLQLHLKTEHLQSGHIPLLTNPRPVVDCSFITDFEDHIFVTVDAEAFFFLHDLISSYVREKERVIQASVANNIRTQSPELPKVVINGGPTNSLENGANNSSQANSTAAVTSSDEDKKRRLLDQMDWRTFECKQWHLEPTVRLLSWAGKRIEPYGVDYILQKLGFSHARTTIPKWVQRGAMDPLDKILSVVLLHTIATQRANEPQVKNSHFKTAN